MLIANLEPGDVVEIPSGEKLLVLTKNNIVDENIKSKLIANNQMRVSIEFLNLSTQRRSARTLNGKLDDPTITVVKKFNKAKLTAYKLML